MPKVSPADEDVELADLLLEYLHREGFDTDAARDGAAGVERALDAGYDIVVLDVMMLRRIRVASRVPVLMLAARDGQVGRILGAAPAIVAHHRQSTPIGLHVGCRSSAEHLEHPEC